MTEKLQNNFMLTDLFIYEKVFICFLKRNRYTKNVMSEAVESNAHFKFLDTL